MIARRALFWLPLAALAIARGARAGQSYDARGVIKSFGPGRAYVNIAHEAIAGFMPAMTMAFEPGSVGATLDGLTVGDPVTFSFTVDDDRYVLTRLSLNR